jgi:hypothetical protein
MVIQLEEEEQTPDEGGALEPISISFFIEFSAA